MLQSYLHYTQKNHCSDDVIQADKVGEVTEALVTYRQLADEISRAMEPHSLDLAIVWGTIALLIRNSLSIQERLEKIVEVLSRVRRVMERVLRCIHRHPDEAKEARIAMVDTMGALALILAETMKFIHQNGTGI